MKAWKLLLAACLALPPLPRVAQAGCRQVVRVHHKQAAVVFAPVYAQPYWYSVGQNYQIAAIVQETIKQQMALQAQQLQAQPCPDGSCPTPQSQQLTAPVPLSLMAKNCQGCHTTNEKAQAAFDMSDLAALTCEQKLAAIAAVVDGSMPKGKQLDAQTLGDLIGQLSGAETAPK